MPQSNDLNILLLKMEIPCSGSFRNVTHLTPIHTRLHVAKGLLTSVTGIDQLPELLTPPTATLNCICVIKFLFSKLGKFTLSPLNISICIYPCSLCLHQWPDNSKSNLSVLQ